MRRLLVHAAHVRGRSSRSRGSRGSRYWRRWNGRGRLRSLASRLRNVSERLCRLRRRHGRRSLSRSLSRGLGIGRLLGCLRRVQQTEILTFRVPAREVDKTTGII